jgi:hypothetical protein
MKPDGSEQTLVVDNAAISDAWPLNRMSIIEEAEEN